MDRPPVPPLAWSRNRAGSGRFLTILVALAALGLPACRENLSPPGAGGSGPDTSGPLVRLSPSADTIVDSVGVLQVLVNASDVSGIKSLDFEIEPPSFAYPTQAPLDTVFGASFTVPLAIYKHTTFRYFVRATDVLDHETVTGRVTVTVR